MERDRPLDPMTADQRLEILRAEARYHRERHELYRARFYGMRPTSETRMRELERARAQAEENLARAERERAKAEGRQPRIIELLQRWGGVTIAYRRRLIDSPSYTLNHEEVEKALEEGIVFAEGLTPRAVDVDEYGAVKGIRFARQRLGEDGKWQADGEAWLPADGKRGSSVNPP